jgi:hypothetical protein
MLDKIMFKRLREKWELPKLEQPERENRPAAAELSLQLRLSWGGQRHLSGTVLLKLIRKG